MVRSRVALVSMGGTIESRGESRLDHAWYHERGLRLGPGELIASIPELDEIADVVVHPGRLRSSSALTAVDWMDLAREVGALVQDHDGVVVLHGTNTLEETAYFLHLTCRTEVPIVLTGALRPPNTLGTDAMLNLLRAVQVAVAPQARGHGVLVGMNDAILAARDVTKAATYRVDAFRTGELGPLGFADADGQVLMYHRHLRAPVDDPFDVARLAALPRVDIVVAHVDADGSSIEAAMAAGARGLVCAGAGAGRPTPLQEQALGQAAESGVVVCLATRAGAGRVALSAASKERFVAADNLQAWKARVLLSLALTRSSDIAEIQNCFDRT